VGFGWDETRIAKRLGFTENYVRDLLTLIGAPAKVRELVATDQISATAALKAMATHGDKVITKIEEGLQMAKAAGKSRVTTRYLVDPSEKVIAKEGPKLYSVVQELRSDPGFVQLGKPLQDNSTSCSRRSRASASGPSNGLKSWPVNRVPPLPRAMASIRLNRPTPVSTNPLARQAIARSPESRLKKPLDRCRDPRCADSSTPCTPQERTSHVDKETTAGCCVRTHAVHPVTPTQPTSITPS